MYDLNKTNLFIIAISYTTDFFDEITQLFQKCLVLIAGFMQQKNT